MILQRILNKPKTRQEDTGPRFLQVPMYQAGTKVTHDTALQSSAVYACVRVIAEDIASLPWNAFTRKPNGTRERAPNSNVEQVLNRRPNPELSPFAFRETMIAWALIWGNGYAEIVRNMAGRVVELYPISPDRVEVIRTREGLIYDVSNSRGENTPFEQRDIFHLHGLGFDGTVGYSTVSLAARSIGLNISLDEFGAQFFGNGAQLGGIITIPETSRLGDDAKKNIRETFNKRHQGPKNSHKVEVLDAGMDYKEIGVQPDKGQFTESKQHQIEEICRWFRVSPQKISHLLRMTFNNVEQLSIDHVQDTLVPWITRLEQEADYKLFGTQNNAQYTKINTNGLLRGDTASRSTFYREMWNLGVYSVNDIRELEDMNPVKNGDKRFVQTNMTTLDKAGEEPKQPEQPETLQVDNAEQNIEDKITTILLKEDNRFSSMLRRYEDRQEYIDRACGYLGSQRINVKKEIEIILCDLLDNVGNDELDNAAKIYSDLHVELSRKHAIRLFDGEEVKSIDQRAKDITQKLINSAIIYSRKQHAITNTK